MCYYVRHVCDKLYGNLCNCDCKCLNFVDFEVKCIVLEEIAHELSKFRIIRH